MPPKPYVRPNLPPGPENPMLYGWAGAMRDDRTVPQFVIMTFSPEGVVRQVDMEPALAALVDRVKIGKKDWKQSPFEHGVINGLPFVRTRWEGFEVTFGRKLFGVSYLTIVGQKVIQLSSQDVAPFHTASLSLAESAVKTFKKQ